MFDQKDVADTSAAHPGEYCIHAAVFQTACHALTELCQREAETARLEEGGLFGTERAIRRTRAAVYDLIAGLAVEAAKRMDRIAYIEGNGCPFERALYHMLDHWIVDWLTRSERMHREALEMNGRRKTLHKERGAVMAECAMMAASCRDNSEHLIGQHNLARSVPEGEYVH